MGLTMAQLLARAKVSKAKFANAPKSKLSSIVNLHGTGITKKLLTSANKQAAKSNKFSITKHIQPDAQAHLQANAPAPASAPEPEPEIKQPAIVSLATTPDFNFDSSQLTAINQLETQQFGCLIGAAGTGKTTVTKELVRRLEASTPLVNINRNRTDEHGEALPDEYTVAIAFAAFTGKAVQMMKKALPVSYHKTASTIHALLGYRPTTELRQDDLTGQYREVIIFRPSFDASNKLPYKVIILDEASMIPIGLWNELIDACTPNTRIFMIGDINQLPPTMGKSVLGFALLKWPSFELTKIHRQAVDNPIIANSQNILKGMFPTTHPKKFVVKTFDEGSLTMANKITSIIKHLHKQGLFNELADALIVPQNKGAIGQLALNEQLVRYFNPQKQDENGTILNKRYIIVAGREKMLFAQDDKVMLLKNDNRRGLTNGMTGVITSIMHNGMYSGRQVAEHHAVDLSNGLDMSDLAKVVDIVEVKAKEKLVEAKRQASHVVTVQFGAADENKEVTFSTAGQLNALTHAYAFTCHKSQGGEYPTAVIVVHSANAIMLCREWLYTAVTRAQERVIILCNNRGLQQAIKTQRIKGKTIEEKAKQFLALSKDDGYNQPDLPEPEEV